MALEPSLSFPELGTHADCPAPFPGFSSVDATNSSYMHHFYELSRYIAKEIVKTLINGEDGELSKLCRLCGLTPSEGLTISSIRDLMLHEAALWRFGELVTSDDELKGVDPEDRGNVLDEESILARWQVLESVQDHWTMAATHVEDLATELLSAFSTQAASWAQGMSQYDLDPADPSVRERLTFSVLTQDLELSADASPVGTLTIRVAISWRNPYGGWDLEREQPPDLFQFKFLPNVGWKVAMTPNTRPAGDEKYTDGVPSTPPNPQGVE